MGNSRRVTIKNLEGVHLFSCIVEYEAEEVARPSGQDGKTESNEEKMTAPQKRYLFRLLAAQGIEGEKAEAHLKDYFKVDSLGKVPKVAASGYIDMLVKGQKGGGP